MDVDEELQVSQESWQQLDAVEPVAKKRRKMDIIPCDLQPRNHAP